MKGKFIQPALFGLVLLFGAAPPGFATADTRAGSTSAVFATVNGEVIYQAAYNTALRVAGRQRFYHGRAPEADLVAFRKEVAERLIEERVLYQEALRQGIQPDQAWIDREFAKIAKRYSVSPQWHEAGETLHRQIRDGLVERSLIEQLDQAYRVAPQQSEQAVRSYYLSNPDKFTSPEQIRVSTILVKVEPWQPKAVWDDARAKVERIHTELGEGGDFDRYAAQHPPEDESQMGYLHRGMLGDTAQKAVDRLTVGEYTGPVVLLEGVAVFRLDERREARLNPFEKVRERAAALLTREQSEHLYRERMAALRSSASVEFADPRYYELAAVGTLQDSVHLGASKQTE